MESSSSAKSAMIGTWGLVEDRSILELGDRSSVKRVYAGAGRIWKNCRVVQQLDGHTGNVHHSWT